MPAAPAAPLQTAADGAARWRIALAAARLFALDPAGLSAVLVRARPGPVRDLWLEELLDGLAPGTPVRRIPVGIGDERLLGGLDLTATLSSGRPVLARGLLAMLDRGVAIVPLAERLDGAVAARLAGVLDRGEVVVERDGFADVHPACLGLILFDEGDASDEAAPEVLRERAAFLIDLDGIALADCTEPPEPVDPAARQRLEAFEPAGATVTEALLGASELLGIAPLRPALLALRAARVHAAAAGRAAILPVDVAEAAALVLAPRATRLPEPSEPEPPPPEPPPPDENAADPPESAPPPDEGDIPAELVLDAIRAALPPGLLAALAASRASARAASPGARAGARQSDPLRGRPRGARKAPLRSGARVALIETLRAAAPWQRLRRTPGDASVALHGARIQVRPADIHLKRFVRKAESTVIFAVDASGSQAFNRLAEVKGAIELVLADAYAARTQVALVSFRGSGAEVLVPPTRALVRARTLLAALPGGGPTPLAAGLEASLLLALAERAKGRSVILIALTDGKANIGLDGEPGRPQAIADAEAVAQRIRAAGLPTILIDSSRFATPEARRLATALDARYVPLPDPRAGAMQALVADALKQPGGRP